MHSLVRGMAMLLDEVIEQDALDASACRLLDIYMMDVQSEFYGFIIHDYPPSNILNHQSHT